MVLFTTINIIRFLVKELVVKNIKEICEKVKEINKLITEVNRLSQKDLYRNYKWREFVNGDNISNIDKSYELELDSNTGDDFSNTRTDRGEDKSSNGVKIYKKNNIININSCRFEFDKINDEYKVDKMFGVEAYSFGFFMNNVLIFSVYCNDEISVNHINEILKNKVYEKKKYFVKCNEKKIRAGRDSVVLSGEEILNCPNIIIIDGCGQVVEKIEDIKL
jgi:hypothetical protein